MACIHDHHPVRVDDLLHIVGDQKDRDPFLFVELMDRFYDLLAAVGVQHGRGLVQDDALGLHGHDACNGHSLLLAAGKLIGRLETVRRHSHGFQAPVHPLPDLVCGHAHIFRSKAHVLFHHIADDLVIRVLEYHAGGLPHVPEMLLVAGLHVGNIDRSIRRKEDPVHQLGKGGFSRAIMAQNGHKAPLLDIQVHPPKGMAHLVLICLFIVSDIVKYQIYCSYDSHSWPFFPGRSRPERRRLPV